MRHVLTWLSAVTLAVSLAPSAGLAQKKPKKIDCHKDLKKAVELIDERWSFKVAKPGYVDLNAVYRELAPESRRAKTPETCADVLDRFMAKLGDGHSSLQSFPGVERTSPDIELRSIRERLSRELGRPPKVHVWVVARDTANDTLKAILPGSEILAIDGLPVDSIYQYMLERVTGSTPQWRDYRCDARLLSGPPDTQIQLRIRGPRGKAKTVVVRRPAKRELSDEQRERERSIYRDTATIASSKRLPGGWGYLKLTTFSFIDRSSTVQRFDEALDSIFDVPGLIIDVRGNGGGITAARLEIASRLVAEETPLTFRQVRRPGEDAAIEYIDWRTGKVGTMVPDRVKPRNPIYAGPLVILVDRRCFSSCEGFSGGLQALGRALVVGSEASGGGSGHVAGLSLPSGARISFSWSVQWLSNGQQVEGYGVAPDIRVREHPRDWAAGRDRVLERAIKALESGEAKALAVSQGT